MALQQGLGSPGLSQGAPKVALAVAVSSVGAHKGSRLPLSWSLQQHCPGPHGTLAVAAEELVLFAEK